MSASATRPPFSTFVVGLGTLGLAAARALAQDGAARIGLMDEDDAEHTATHLSALAPSLLAEPYPARLDDTNAAAVLTGYDVVLDCTGDVHARSAVNRACFALRVPFVTAALDGERGWVAALRPGEGACWECVRTLVDDEQCRGPSATAPAAVHALLGSLMAFEGRRLSSSGAGGRDRLLLFALDRAHLSGVRAERSSECAFCARSGSNLEPVT